MAGLVMRNGYSVTSRELSVAENFDRTGLGGVMATVDAEGNIRKKLAIANRDGKPVVAQRSVEPDVITGSRRTGPAGVRLWWWRRR